MDETTTPSGNSDSTSAKSPGGQVMDIQTPKPTNNGGSAPILSPQDSSLETNNTNEPNGVVEAPTTPEPLAAGANSPDSTDNNSASEAPANTPDDPVAATSPEPTTQEPNPLAIPPSASKPASKPVLVIMVAVIVALGLAGLVVYSFMKTKKDTKSTASNAASTQMAPKPQASPADVDATTKEIETGLSKVDDTKDFSSADLSDKSLGL